jgi:hypothetical protein
VTLLAYTEGEEVFVDANGNNKFDSGETFYDMGQPFLDANENALREATEQKIGDPSIPGSGIGTSACTTHAFQVANVAGTCDGVWGSTRVRQQMVIAFSASHGVAVVNNADATGINITLLDDLGNAMPMGSTLTATLKGGTGCSIDTVIPAVVPSTPNPTRHDILLTATGTGATCSGATVTLRVTTPKNNQTLLGTVTIP